MSNDKTLSFAFRKPVLPILVDVNGHVIVAESDRALLQKLVTLDPTPGDDFDAVDAAGEGWSVHMFEEGIVVSPLVWKKAWTKLELIRLCNGRRNRPPDEKPYPETSLGSKKLSRIISDLARRLLEAERRH
jgi:hypothetical protein